MKKLLVVAALIFCAGKAQAQNKVFDVGYASYTVVGVKCSSGTGIEITSIGDSTRTLSGFQIVGYRVQNHDASYHSWLSNNPSVSSTTVSTAQRARIGERLIKDGGSLTYMIGQNPDRSTPKENRIYCITEDGAGANGITVSVAAFGIR